MECPKCRAENNDASRFCGNCAAPRGRKPVLARRALPLPRPSRRLFAS